MKKKTIISAIVFIMLFSLTGCGNSGFERGFEFDRYDDSTYTAVRSRETEFDKNNVTLEFFFGWESSLASNDRYEILGFGLYFTDRLDFHTAFSQFDDYRDIEGATFLVKISNDEAFSGKFNVKWHKRLSIGPFGWADRKIFSHSEMITIPPHFFTGNVGTIYFVVIPIAYHSNWFTGNLEGTFAGHGMMSNVGMSFKSIENNKIRIGNP